MPAISVIMPTRRRNHLLGRALRSLWNQSFKDFEVLLVDDNPSSSRVGHDLLLQPLLQDQRLRILENPIQRNAACARNCGLRSAKGEWITYLDDDDAYHPDKLDRQLACAQATKLPLGLCGLSYNLKGRRRVRQTGKKLFSGSEILLETTPGTPMLFHRNTGDVFFDETLDAGEDAHFFFRLVERFQVQEVFNVPAALVEVYPQPGARVNLNEAALWQATQAVYQDFAPAFGEKAARVFLARATIQKCKFGGGFSSLVHHTLVLLKITGGRDLRLLANVWLFKIHWLRPFLVS